MTKNETKMMISRESEFSITTDEIADNIDTILDVLDMEDVIKWYLKHAAPDFREELEVQKVISTNLDTVLQVVEMDDVLNWYRKNAKSAFLDSIHEIIQKT